MPLWTKHFYCNWRTGDHFGTFRGAEWFVTPAVTLYVDDNGGVLSLHFLRLELGFDWWPLSPGESR